MEIVIPALNDVWMDNGVETLYRLLKEAQNSSFIVKIDNNSLIITVSDYDKFKESVGIAVKNRRSNLFVIDEDKKLGEKKEVKKDYILIQEGKKVGGKVAFKEELYNEKTTADTVNRIFDLIAEKGERRCVVCGRQFSKSMKKLQQAAYPFVTKIKSLSGVRSYKDGEVYSFKEYFEDFCPTCYLIGIAEWLDDGIIYRTVPGEKSTLFLPRFNKLDELIKFKNTYRSLLNKNDRYRNIRVKIGSEETENTSGSFSTLLCFYEKFFFSVDKKDLIGKSWAMMEVPFGAVKNIKLNVIDLTESVLRVIKELSEDKISIYKGIITEMFFFYDNPKVAPVDWDLTNEIRENISEAILEDDFRSFAINLLPRKGGHVGYSKDTRQNIEDLIYAWRLKNMGLDEEQLKTIKSAGRTIAAASKDHRSLLYKLDKAKDKTALLDALRQVSRRIAGLKVEEKEKYKGFIYPLALEDIVSLLEKHESNNRFIEDIKNTLVIFSCVEFSRLEYIGERKEGD
ncbi:MAG: hypothetical protein O8C58_00255 [Candidatus Methanoperedens sp.]|nr:hypothetical protein [Candidatus Methanoperedens sp.]MCZ7361769.1 hypothetical protein [Candidatus Methanoperedens sp.]HLB72065.1 hypothetical protein [Candidatus Methanoperedens sp.]